MFMLHETPPVFYLFKFVKYPGGITAEKGNINRTFIFFGPDSNINIGFTFIEFDYN
jgi:hypothetical protein